MQRARQRSPAHPPTAPAARLSRGSLTARPRRHQLKEHPWGQACTRPPPAPGSWRQGKPLSSQAHRLRTVLPQQTPSPVLHRRGLQGQQAEPRAGRVSGRPGLPRPGTGSRSCGSTCRAGRPLGSGTRARWLPLRWAELSSCTLPSQSVGRSAWGCAGGCWPCDNTAPPPSSAPADQGQLNGHCLPLTSANLLLLQGGRGAGGERVGGLQARNNTEPQPSGRSSRWPALCVGR